MLLFRLEARKYSPDLTVLLFFDNDVWFNTQRDEYRSQKPVFELREGALELTNVPVPESLHQCEKPEQAAEYWRLHIQTGPYFNPEVEGLYVLMLNTRRRVKGHTLVSMGTMDTLLVTARETFRAAVVGAASAVIA